MQFVRSSILRSVDGVHLSERKTKSVTAEGLDYFSDRDAFVSQQSVEKKLLCSTGVEQRGGHRIWKNPHQNSITASNDIDEDYDNDFPLPTVTQEEFEFLEFHAKKQKKQDLANERAVQMFYRNKESIKVDEPFLDRIAVVQRNKEKQKETQMKNSLKSGFDTLIIKKRKVEPSSDNSPLSKKGKLSNVGLFDHVAKNKSPEKTISILDNISPVNNNDLNNCERTQSDIKLSRTDTKNSVPISKSESIPKINISTSLNLCAGYESDD